MDSKATSLTRSLLVEECCKSLTVNNSVRIVSQKGTQRLSKDVGLESHVSSYYMLDIHRNAYIKKSGLT